MRGRYMCTWVFVHFLIVDHQHRRSAVSAYSADAQTLSA
jgi:hypothetical protein